MFYLIFSIHCLICLLIVGLVLVQQGKGADMGAAFGGGGSNTVFGAAGAGNFLTRLTTGAAIAFMVTSILLVKTYSAGKAPAQTSGRPDVTQGSVFEEVETAAPEKTNSEDSVVPDVEKTTESKESS